MNIFSKLFGSKKTDEVLEDVQESHSHAYTKYSAPDTETVKFEEIPSDLPEALRYIVVKLGKEQLLNRGFINILNDFHILKEMPAVKNVLLTMLTDGYIPKYLAATNWKLDSPSYTLQFAKNYGTNNELVSYIIQSFGYGLSYTNTKPVFIEISNSMPGQSQATRIHEEPVYDKTREMEVDKVDNEILEPYDPKRDLDSYHYPALNLLDSKGKPYIDKHYMQAIQDLKQRIVDILINSFGFQISSIKLIQGASINFFEIVPANGMRLNMLKDAEDEFTMLLSPRGVRLQLPIPGTGNVGLEIPRNDPQRLTFEEVVNTRAYQESVMDLPCAIGKTMNGGVLMFDLAQLPHLLIGGATGQGKSICVHSILLSLLYKKHPAEVKFVLVDFKKIELGCYDVLSKHFLAAYWENVDNPIISNATQADETFAALKSEFNARFELISKSGTRNIKDYNRKFVMRRLNPEQGHKFMPYIVIFIDEYSDLINSDRRFLEPIISEIAKKGRAVGIHMVLATNRPTADIVDNAIKTELGGKIAFRVSTAIDSRLILNTGGAEKLIGEGDMLFVDKRNLLQRAQCALPSFDDIDRVCDYISKQQGYPEPYELYYRDESEEVTDNSVDMSHLDPLFDDAARLIVMEQLGSTSLVQRKFAIGYNRAGRLLDQLEKAGIVGQAHGSKPREVFVKDEYSLNRILQRYR